MEAQTDEPRESGTEQTSSDGPHRILLVADDVVDANDLTRELESHVKDGSGKPEVFVISPAISHSRLDQELGNVDPVLPEAGERMETLVKELSEAGFKARGTVGDSDLLVAIGDGLAEFQADEIVAVTHVKDEAEPAERGLWLRLKDEFHQPVTLLTVSNQGRSDAQGAEVVSTEHAPAHQETYEEEIRETRNFPPLSKRDIAGILFGILGTIALGIIAVFSGENDDGNLTGSTAAILLIAIGCFLLNVAHVVGLLFFESVRYDGIWDKFMARMSIGVTSAGLIAALILWLA